MKNINILLTDDHAILRYGIRVFLSSIDNITVSGEASSGEECLEMCKELKPDICLLDIELPKMNGIETAKAIKENNADIKILILSMHLNKQQLNEAMQIGINGYLLKSAPKQSILDGIRTVAGGDQVFNNSVSKMIADSFIDDKKSSGKDKEDAISEREKEVLNLVVAGYSSAKIAKKLFISPRTVDTHRSNIMKKLNVNNTAALVRYALKNDLLDSLRNYTY